jgi:excisionase family DNA binding protein
VELNNVDSTDLPDLSPREVAAILGLSYHAILRAIHRGDVPAYKLCGRLRLRRRDLRDWIEESRLAIEDPAQRGAPDPPTQGSLLSLRELERRRTP